jgi:pimeloyl-ACP methyl ester carboxylesterase
MHVLQSNGKEIAYATGHGGIEKGRKTLVFVHGSGASHLHWNYQRQFFQKSHNVVLVDLPGHGKASTDGEESVEAYANHLRNLLRSLPVDVFCLFGHSLGGAIAQTFGLLHPKYLEALILVGTGVRLRVKPEILTGIVKRFEATVRLINDYAFSSETPSELILKGVDAMLKTRPAVLHGDFTSCDRFDIMDRVAEIQVPTFVICGRDDLLTPPKYAYYLAESIRGAKVEIIDGAGHMVMIEQPDNFNHRVSEFLETLGGKK